MTSVAAGFNPQTTTPSPLRIALALLRPGNKKSFLWETSHAPGRGAAPSALPLDLQA
jgi:hypothetical protein